MKLVLGCVILVLPVIAWHDGNHLLRMDRNIKKLITDPKKEQAMLALGYMDSFLELFEYLIEKMIDLRDSAKESADFYLKKRPDGPKFSRLPSSEYENCERVYNFDNETALKFTTIIELTNSLWPKFISEHQRLQAIETNKSEEQIIFGPGP